MHTPVLTDKEQFPTEEVIFSHIGKTKELWMALFEHVRKEHPDLTEEWRYYIDGKSWLMKLTKKTKTIFWLSVSEDTFIMTFYFTDRAAEVINNSNISEELKEQFCNAKYYNKIRPLTISFKNKKDVEYAKVLIAIKLSIK